MSNRKKKNSSLKWFIAAVIIIALIGGTDFASLLEKANKEVIQEANRHADVERMEIPLMDADAQGQIINRTGYTLAYNAKTKTPQWVAWELTKAETRGDAERNNEFLPDPQVIGTKVETYDYSNSGYDRGHMAPAGDMKWSEEAMQESFYMSNICPQNHNLNKGDWNDLEIKTREWARRYGKAYVVCGPIYREGKTVQSIGTHRVSVPHAFFKAILVYRKDTPIAMGFLFENREGHRPLKNYLVSVDSLESLTGMDFFSQLPDEVETVVERETALP